MLLGIGFLIGLRVALSLLLGAVIAWALIAPGLIRTGTVTSSEYEVLSAWLAWPGLGLTIGAVLTSFARKPRVLVSAIQDLLRASPRGRTAVSSRMGVLALAAAVTLTLTGWLALH